MRWNSFAKLLPLHSWNILLLFFTLFHARRTTATSATTCCSSFQLTKHQFDLKPIPFALLSTQSTPSQRLFTATVFFSFSHRFVKTAIRFVRVCVCVCCSCSHWKMPWETVAPTRTCIRSFCCSLLLFIYKLKVHVVDVRHQQLCEASFWTYFYCQTKFDTKVTQIIWELVKPYTWRMENIGRELDFPWRV